MTGLRADGGQSDRAGLLPIVGGVDLEEFRRRNPIGVGMDLLFLVTTGFFAHMLVTTTWTAIMAAIPMLTVLYFGWNSSKAFFVAQVITIVAVMAASLAGAVPL